MGFGLGSAIQRTVSTLRGQWLTATHHLNRWSIEGYSGEDGQRQIELLEIVREVVNDRVPGETSEITEFRAPSLTSTYVRKHIDLKGARFCFWDLGQPRDVLARLWAHSS